MTDSGLSLSRPSVALPILPRLLIVDDEPAVRTLLTIGLSREGFDVTAASTGAEAVACFEQATRTIDLVLLDVNMPGLDGPQTMAALREINPNVRCCFMSGYLGRYSPEELSQLGSWRIFPKPFRLKEIADSLRGVLELSRAG